MSGNGEFHGPEHVDTMGFPGTVETIISPFRIVRNDGKFWTLSLERAALPVSGVM